MTKQFEVGGIVFKCAIDNGFEGISGTVGFFDVKASDFNADLFSEGFDQMEAWVKAQGVETIFGPFAGNTLYPYRFRTSHYSESPFWGEPANSEQVVQWLLDRDYQISESYVSSRIHNTPEVQSRMTEISRGLPATLIQDFKAVAVDKNVWLEKKQEVFELTLEAFKGNFLFKPYSFSQFDQIYDPLIRQAGMISESSVLLMSVEKIVGFCFNFEDKQNVYLKTIGVHPNYRKLGTSFLYLLSESYKRLPKEKDLVLCLMKEGNVPDLFSSSGVVEKRTYGLFKRDLRIQRSPN